MDLVRVLISIGRMAREEAKIKVRQPISEVILDGKHESILKDLVNLIKEELNVKEVIFESDLSKYMNFTIKPNFKVAGPIFGGNIKEFANALNNYKEEDIKNLQNGQKVSLKIGDNEYDITLDLVDIRINSKEGFDVGMQNNNFIILNTNLTKELIEEGIAREFVSKIQNLRKTKEFDIENRISTQFNASPEIKEAILNNLDYIKGETLSTTLEFVDKTCAEEIDINGNKASVTIEKI